MEQDSVDVRNGKHLICFIQHKEAGRVNAADAIWRTAIATI